MDTEIIKIRVSKTLAPHWLELVDEVGPSSHYPVAGDRVMAAAAAQFRRQASTRLAIQRYRERQRRALGKKAVHKRSR